jgi:hypothetical protein
LQLKYTKLNLVPVESEKEFFLSKNRECLLLRFETLAGVGYSEYTPWEQLGQTDREVILQQVRTSKHHWLVQRTWMDVFKWQRLLEDDLPAFKNHSFAMAGKLLKISNEVLKLKLQGSVSEDLAEVRVRAKEYKTLRLDANFKYQLKEFHQFWDLLGPEQGSVDYIEDPIPFDEKQYHELENKGVPLAVDQPYNQKKTRQWKRRVYKPSINLQSGLVPQDTFSCNMGHPLGLWQDYCELYQQGDTSQFHGLYMPQLYNDWDTPFRLDSTGLVSVDKAVVIDQYKRLDQLEWKSL